MKESFENLSAKYLDEYIWKDRTIIIDIRDEDEFMEGHVQNAINIPYDKIEKNQFNISNQYELILYCERGGLSLLAAKQLSKMGYRVKTVVGGLNAYRGKIY